MLLKRIFSLLVFCFLLCIEKTEAQLYSTKGNDRFDTKSDTSKNKSQLKTNDSVVIYSVSYRTKVHQPVDTSILFQYRNPFLSIWDHDLGNTGTAYQSILFRPNMQPSMQLGMQHNQAYLFQRDSLKYYNTTRPYTDIYYWMGRKQEQCIQLFHSQNVNQQWNLSAAYRKLVSPGNFKYLRSNQDAAFLNSWYQSKNKRYENKASLIYNKLQQDESGGILSELQISNPSFNDRRLLPVLYESSTFSVNRSSVLNHYRNASFNMIQLYDFGTIKKDSAGQDVLLPSFGLKHEMYLDVISQYYKDLQPDSLEYGYVYDRDRANKDSLYHRHYVTQFGNTFSLNQSLRIKDKVTKLEAGYGLELEELTHRFTHTYFLNNFIFGKLAKQQAPGDRWNYQAMLKFYFTGNAQGNFLLDAQLGRKISERIGQIGIAFSQSLSSPDYKTAFYYDLPTADQVALKKTAINHLAVSYLNTTYKASADLHQYSVLNWNYTDTNLMVRQYTTLISVTQAVFHKAFHWRTYRFENDLFVQQVSQSSPIHLPVFATCNRLYLDRKILKNKLMIATGLEMRYNSPFKADNYQPVFQSFAPQYVRTIANVPMFSYFFNFRVKRFKASLSVDEIQQLYAVNNLNYPFYPTPNLMLRFKLNWVFIN